MARPLIVDGRNFLDAEALTSAGFEYEGIGRAARGLTVARRHGLRPMQAIVLVGGEGTRLRPLTLTVPKPALTLVDRPFLAYMIEWLAGHGVTEVVLACGFLPDVLREALAGEEERAGVRIRYVGRARAARHRRRDPLCRRGARRRPRRPLPGAQRRRPHRPRPDRAPARPRGARGAGDARAGAGRGLFGLRAGAHRRGRRGLGVHREDRRRGPRRDQRRDVRPGALGARPDRARAGGLDRARRLPAAGRRGPVRAPARRLLDGHRDAGALPAGELGHPRGQGGNAGEAERSRPAGRSERDGGRERDGGAARRARRAVPAGARRAGARIGPARGLRGGRGRSRQRLDPRPRGRGRPRRRARGRGGRRA